MGTVETALARRAAHISIAETRGLAVKAAGGAPFLELSPSVGASMVGHYADQGANRMRYSKFRGWVHAAINALADQAAGQQVHVGRMKKSSKKSPRGSKILDATGKAYDPNVKKVTRHEFKAMGVPDRIRTKAANNELEVFQDHPLLKVLQKPNPIQHSWQFVYSFVANLCLTGFGYVVGGRNEAGDLEYYSIPTTWVFPDHSKGAFAEFYIRNPRNPANPDNDEPLTRENVGFAFIPNPSDPLLAMAPIQAQDAAVKVDENIQSSQAMFFENAIFPSAVVTVGTNPHPDVPGGVRPRLSAAQRRQVYAAIRKVMAGVANYGNPAILDGMIEKIERLSATQNEIGWEKSEKSVRTRILSAFSVHPFILGEEMAGSYAQAYVVESRFFSRVNVFLSMLGTLLQEHAPGLLEDDEDSEDLQVWYEECRAVDPSMEKSTWDSARARGDVSQNEYRAWMNLPPDEDKNEAVVDKTTVTALVGLASSVREGKVDPKQAQAIMRGMGLPDDLAKDIAGKPAPQPAGGDMGGGFGGEGGGGFGDQEAPNPDDELGLGSLDEEAKSLQIAVRALSETQDALKTLTYSGE